MKKPGLYTTLIAEGDGDIASAARKAVDYDNRISGSQITANHGGYVFASIRYTNITGIAGTEVLELFIMPGNGQDPEVFPEGGDASLGSNFDPQDIWSVGSFQSVTPSTTETEVLALWVDLPPGNCRFVFKNLTANAFHEDTKAEILGHRAHLTDHPREVW
jgi:hypothetical protein